MQRVRYKAQKGDKMNREYHAKYEFYSSTPSDFNYCPIYERMATGAHGLTIRGTDRHLHKHCQDTIDHTSSCLFCKDKKLRCIRLHAILRGASGSPPRGYLNQQNTSNRIFDHIENCSKCEEMLISFRELTKRGVYVHEK